MEWFDQILCGDCAEGLSAFPDNCIDLIFTSPPYADQRTSTCGGVPRCTGGLRRVPRFSRLAKPSAITHMGDRE